MQVQPVVKVKRPNDKLREQILAELEDYDEWRVSGTD